MHLLWDPPFMRGICLPWNEAWRCWTCPCSVIPAGLSLEQIIASLWLGFSVLHPFLGVFLFSPFLLLCPHPNLVCLLCAVTGCHLLFLFWGMREPKGGHRFIAFNFVKMQIKLSYEECCALLIWFYVCGGSYPYGVRTLPSGLTSHEVKKSYAWNINLILY